MWPIFDILPGLKTYIAAAGLAGLAIWNFSQGDFAGGWTHLMAALALVGIRNAIARGVTMAHGKHK